ncbi:White collar 1 protein [Ceratobasidium sp. AG-Ba]|nr:White collar 1 protein [Ceratobasidium sp. AG-Ba]
MSGYALEDIRGRNPRFMQAPGGHVLTPPRPVILSPTPQRPHTQSPGAPTEADRPGPSVAGDNKVGSDESGHTITPPNPTPTPTQSSTTHAQSQSRESYAYIPPPSSHVPAGSERTHTSKATVAHIKAKLDANEEVQTTILNYRRDGTPFWNWLSVVPVREAGEGSRFRYHVGIMVDLVQQPRAIIQTMQAGFYIRTQS